VNALPASFSRAVFHASVGRITLKPDPESVTRTGIANPGTTFAQR